jgi:hypothetical protein
MKGGGEIRGSETSIINFIIINTIYSSNITIIYISTTQVEKQRCIINTST